MNYTPAVALDLLFAPAVKAFNEQTPLGREERAYLMKLSSAGIAISFFASLPFAFAQTAAPQGLPSQAIVDQAVGDAMSSERGRQGVGYGVAAAGGVAAITARNTLANLRREGVEARQSVRLVPIDENLAGQVRRNHIPTQWHDYDDLIGFSGNRTHYVSGGSRHYSRIMYIDDTLASIASLEVTNNLNRRLRDAQRAVRDNAKVTIHFEVHDSTRTITYSDGIISNRSVNTYYSRSASSTTTFRELQNHLISLASRHEMLGIERITVEVPPVTERLPAMSLSEIRSHNARIASAQARLNTLGGAMGRVRIGRGLAIAAIPTGLVIALTGRSSGQTLQECLSSNQPEQKALCEELNSLLPNGEVLAESEQTWPAGE